MKKLIFRLAALLLCFILCGCALIPGGDATDPSKNLLNSGPKPGEIPSHVPTLPSGAHRPVEVVASGAVQVPHSVDISSIRYITAADQLPDYDDLKKYDDRYFADHALVLILETVGTAAVQVSLEGITTDGSAAWATLLHKATGDATIPVKTTWLVWAEVEKGLDYTWTVENPSLDAGASDR